MKTLSLFRVFAAVALLGTAAAVSGCASSSKQQSTGEYVDDAAITTKVKAAILQDSALKVMQIQVTTRNNVVQLSGAVDSAQMVAHAGTVAGGVAGVSSVKNDLVIKR
jgi:hyperosmotically inducible protein